MKSTAKVSVLGLLTVGWLLAGTLAAQQPGGKAQEGEKPKKPALPDIPKVEGQMPDDAAMQAAWEAAGKPGPQHEQFKKMVGAWKTEMKDYHGGPEPTVSSGTAEFKLIMDGRYLVENFKGEHMGKPFEGLGISGYDNTTKKYFVSWYDNMSTGSTRLEGDYDAATKTTTMTGSMPMPGGGACTMKGISREVSDKQHVFEMFMTMAPGMPEMKAMEITYTR